MTLRPRILVLDDEPTIRFAMREYLEPWFEVDTAAEREEGEALISCRTYAAVILDIRLGGSDSREGLEVVRAARDRSAATRIILLTAFASPEYGARAIARGADVVLRKPRPMAEIADILHQLIEAAP